MSQIYNINKDAAVKLIEDNDGSIFKVVFRKRTNNKLRKMVCRKGVKKYVTGKGMAYDPKTRDLVTVFDMQKQQYRHISLDALKIVRIKGITYRVK